jgi:tetratricopeptide (TPR) repeat protein
VEAIDRIEAVLRVDPQNLEALFLVGLIASRHNVFDMAIDYLMRAMKLQPNNATIRHYLGKVHLDDADPVRAERQLKKAVSLAPDRAHAIYDLARCYELGGKPAKAIETYEALLGLDADRSRAILGIGKAKEQMGDHAGAEATFREAIEAGIAAPLAWRGLSQQRTFKDDPPELPEIEALLESDAMLDEKAQSNLHWAAGKIADDSGQHDRAWPHFVAGKRLDYPEYDIGRRIEIADAMKETFTASFFEERKDAANPSSRPVFVLGMPRSGTTLTEQIIASHPKADSGGEMTYFNRISNRLAFVSTSPEAFVKHASALDVKDLKSMASGFLAQLDSISTSAKRIVDKMPHNFDRLWLIALLFPNATYIHSIRNPMDNCLSLFSNGMSDTHGYSRTLDDLGRYYCIYRDLVEHWRGHAPISIHDSVYENLVSDSETASRQLIDETGLPWAEACLRHQGGTQTIRTLSHRQARQPVYQTSVQRWRRYADHLGPLRNALGDYAPAG